LKQAVASSVFPRGEKEEDIKGKAIFETGVFLSRNESVFDTIFG
jgi:hypothetical protein